MFRFHITYPQFMLPNSANTVCAFTQKARKFAKMMTLHGHEVYFYGHEDSEVICTELIPVLTKNDFTREYGKEPDWNDPVYVANSVNNKTQAAIKIANIYHVNILIEMRKRIQKNDFICSFWGFPDSVRPLKMSHGAILVEPGIGCPRIFADYCAYESYAIMHHVYGKNNTEPKAYDAVIPNYFDLDEFDTTSIQKKKKNKNKKNKNKKDENGNDKISKNENKKDGLFIPDKYFLFLGRIDICKGIRVVVEVARQLPNENFVFVGPGKIELPNIPSNVFVYPPVGAEGRLKWMSNAKGFLLPTLYLEPFGGGAVEAMLCGTPAITSDWGVFNETVVHGYTGYRCRTIEQFIFAVRNIHLIKREDCKNWAQQNYSLQAVYPKFKEWFSMLKRLHTYKNGRMLDYDAPNNEREEMDWLKINLPFSHNNKNINQLNETYIQGKNNTNLNEIKNNTNLNEIISKIKVAVYARSQWAFGTIFNGLIEATKNSNYEIELIDWSVNYPPYFFMSYDIVVAPTWDTAKVMLEKYITKRPILFSGHGLVEFINHKFEDISPLSITAKDVDNFILQPKLFDYLKEHHFSVVSQQLYDIFKDEPFEFKNIYYTPCGVDLNVFKPIENKIITSKLRVVHMHIKHEIEHGYNVKRMYLIEKITKKIISLGYNSDKIEFIYPTEIIPAGKEMRDFYIKGDVWLCISHSEGNPLGCLEAGACGLTVITTNVGDMSNFIENDINGYLVNVKDEDKIVDEFVEHIITLYENPDKLKAMQQKLYEKTISSRDWKIVGLEWLKFFDTYLENMNKKEVKKETNYDFIEIGTADFNTEIEKCTDETRGLSVEPIKSYLDKLPEKKNVTKLNYAISDKNGETTIYYIELDTIKKYNLPDWIKGCNTVNDYHPTVIKELQTRKISSDIVSKHIVRMIDFETFVKENNIIGCKYLKIDTEGHDHVILNNMLDFYEKKDDIIFNLPHRITFETNILTNNEITQKLILRLQNYGYKLEYTGETTTIYL